MLVKLQTRYQDRNIIVEHSHLHCTRLYFQMNTVKKDNIHYYFRLNKSFLILNLKNTIIPENCFIYIFPHIFVSCRLIVFQEYEDYRITLHKSWARIFYISRTCVTFHNCRNLQFIARHILHSKNLKLSFPLFSKSLKIPNLIP